MIEIFFGLITNHPFFYDCQAQSCVSSAKAGLIIIEKRIGSTKPKKDEYIKTIDCLKKEISCKKFKNLCPIFVDKCSYTDQDEREVKDIKKGELYLFDGGQLRLYFKDVKDADIMATPVGYFADASNIEKLVTTAHDENEDDTWGVEVYFRLTKN